MTGQFWLHLNGRIIVQPQPAHACPPPLSLPLSENVFRVLSPPEIQVPPHQQLFLRLF